MATRTPIPPKEFTTARLLLRPPARSDARAIFEGYAQDPEVTRFLVWAPHKNISETRAFLRRAAAARRSGSEYTFALTLRRTGTLVGMIALRIAPPKADLGYVITRAHWNKGYATEAAGALASWAIAQERIHRVWAVFEPSNTASGRVLEKIGMRKEGTLRRWMFHSGATTPIDCVCYALIKEKRTS
jgi:RimJ/RimL family protein N-acetyltransferase